EAGARVPIGTRNGIGVTVSVQVAEGGAFAEEFLIERDLAVIGYLRRDGGAGDDEAGITKRQEMRRHGERGRRFQAAWMRITRPGSATASETRLRVPPGSVSRNACDWRIVARV